MSEEHIEGLAELSKKLNALGAELGVKTLRQAAVNATTPALREMKLAAPVGSKAHRTYKGNIATPGFLKRGIKRVSKIIRGRAVVMLGVKREAFYGVLFVEKGTKKMSAKPWFVRSFTGKRKEMEDRLAQQLRTKIQKIAAK